MAQQYPHRHPCGNRLPKPYAKIAMIMRPGLVQAMRGAVETGDAPAAKSFFRALVGPVPARRLSEKNALSELKSWLVQET